MIPFFLGIACGAAICFIVCWMSYLMKQQTIAMAKDKEQQKRILAYRDRCVALQARLSDPLDLGDNNNVSG